MNTATMDFEIEEALENLRKQISHRKGLSDDDPQAPRAEEMLCIQSRTLVARFADAAIWEGVTRDTLRIVEEALGETLACITLDKKLCGKSVERRIGKFHEFLKENPTIFKPDSGFAPKREL